jgi:hypothetical protein
MDAVFIDELRYFDRNSGRGIANGYYYHTTNNVNKWREPSPIRKIDKYDKCRYRYK